MGGCEASSSTWGYGLPVLLGGHADHAVVMGQGHDAILGSRGAERVAGRNWPARSTTWLRGPANLLMRYLEVGSFTWPAPGSRTLG